MWFPTGKIVFMAPTRPLVTQQIAACSNIMGIPEEDTAQLEGSIPASARERLWREKRVFFCTPQVVENDLISGKVNGLDITCLVFDEAHRTTGSYSYVKVVIETYATL
jgi:Fanconi anemia group M protein